jgi:hypothetical protein
MRILPTALLAGVAAIAIGFSGAAFARGPQIHVMTVQLPDGGVARIRYTGDVAPRISFGEAPVSAETPPLSAPLFGPGSPFAALDRISAEMDREMSAMLGQAAALSAAAQSGRLATTALRGLPPGSTGFSFVSTMSGNGVCSQSLQITSTGNGPPHIVRHSSGNCGTAGPGAFRAFSPPATAPVPVWIKAPAQPYAAPAPANRPDVVWTSAEGAKPYAGLVRKLPAAAR